MQKQRRREYKMLKGLDKLEKKQDVQEKYNEWRRKAENLWTCGCKDKNSLTKCYINGRLCI